MTWITFVPDLLGGLWVAVQLTVLSLVLGYPLGMILANGVGSRIPPVRWISLAIVEVGRGIPLLVLLYLVYQGLPQIGQVPGAMTSAVAAFTISSAAYSTEILRASLGAVPPGQLEAAKACGMSPSDSFRLITLPQAVRLALPPLMSLAIQMFQLTSLAYLVTVPEIMQAAKFRGTVTFDYLNVYIAAAALYAAVTIPASLLVNRLEGRLSRHL